MSCPTVNAEPFAAEIVVMPVLATPGRLCAWAQEHVYISVHDSSGAWTWTVCLESAQAKPWRVPSYFARMVRASPVRLLFTPAVQMQMLCASVYVYSRAPDFLCVHSPGTIFVIPREPLRTCSTSMFRSAFASIVFFFETTFLSPSGVGSDAGQPCNAGPAVQCVH